MTAFEQLMAYERDTQALGQIAGRLGWDQETMMPRGATGQRGAEMAAIESVLHARRSAPQVAEWLEQAEAPDEVGAAHLREIRRSYDRTIKVPADLAKKLAQVTSEAQGKWAEARANEDVAAFLPVLEEVVALKREEGKALAAGGDLYDALVADYEHGTTSSEIAKIFDAMRPGLVDLRARVLDKPAPQGLSGRFDEKTQMQLARTLARTFGYDMAHGRVDKAVHPFSSGSGLDVRITTRTSETDPFNCFYSTIHEVGHGAYEQNISRDYLLTPLGRGVSMGVHESQSRIYENQIGRSRAFTGWLFEQMRDSFGDIGVSDADAFYAAVNKVHNGYIRTEADELQYNLHIMLRFDLERALMQGDLEVADLEAAWNDRFEADFGYAVDKPSNGCLQDVHWSVGLFGYFPTYSLGNVYAGCLHEALRRDVPKLDTDLAQGDTSAATGWLGEKLQQHGGLRSPRDTIAHAAEMEPDHAPLMNYLEQKFGALYDL
ncbi:MAG: carboxypeptidase M32 [Pseudophaeobacter sp. bin_em_oilr2.035]|uniref:Metal-dependent carboxypeptidase n=1 Tax=Phaeobacter gallaeciensis TaxID=60890 RepID=A0ABD4X5F0_9RHOB|nr:carboxypeptidase M32 [Phaeobacter gallaeciensis]MDF1773449.1 carboxypeptidase M32 [Pseudophaeobacter sp. bin_em_oilr2.035]MDE4143583.1 carboxypeptidase M32 [Phaeobacter gallaeciensis]MDE4156055.1 carboxypeptidase M32 [Phaeobacter gallaeciensis]MDE4160243.1 carboxypeptidase M32 [Phaeobacter gallaeciensis]MDE4164663.1 carboxypeptidase M32 [Phaeobacter gallaeciensis]